MDGRAGERVLQLVGWGWGELDLKADLADEGAIDGAEQLRGTTAAVAGELEVLLKDGFARIEEATRHRERVAQAAVLINVHKRWALDGPHERRAPRKLGAEIVVARRLVTASTRLGLQARDDIARAQTAGRRPLRP